MEFSWRTIMILIGLVVVVVILVDGFRRMRQARTAALRLDVAVGQQNDLDDPNPELPGDGFRVVSNQANPAESHSSTETSDLSATGTDNHFASDTDANKNISMSEEDNKQPSPNSDSLASLASGQKDTSKSSTSDFTDIQSASTQAAGANNRIEPFLSGFDPEPQDDRADLDNLSSTRLKDQTETETETEESLNGVAGIEALMSSVAKKNSDVAVEASAVQGDAQLLDSQSSKNAELKKYADIVSDSVVSADAAAEFESHKALDSKPVKADQSQASMFERLMGNAGVQLNLDQDVASVDALEASAEEVLIDSIQQSAPEERAGDASELVAAANKYLTEVEPQSTAAEEVAHAITTPVVEDEQHIDDPELDIEVDGLPTEPIKLPVNYAGPNAEVLANRPEPELVLVINTIASDPDGFDGEALLFLLNSCDLRFGEKSIFHRFELADGAGCVQFSVAQSHEPGVFDAETMSTQRFTGLTFFLSLPGAKKPLEAYEAMYELAMAVSRNLKADVLDGSYSAMTTQTREHDRQLILDFERRQQLLAKKAQR